MPNNDLPYEFTLTEEQLEHYHWWKMLLEHMGGIDPQSKVDFMFTLDNEGKPFFDWENETVETLGHQPWLLAGIYANTKASKTDKNISPIYVQRPGDMGAVKLQVSLTTLDGPFYIPYNMKAQYKKARVFYEQMTELLEVMEDPGTYLKNPEVYRRIMVASDDNPPKMTPLFPEGKAPFDTFLAVDAAAGMQELMEKMERGEIYLQKPGRKIYTNIRYRNGAVAFGKGIADESEWKMVREPIQNEKPPHSSFGMFFYKVFNSMNKKWCAKQLKEQADFYDNQAQRLREAEQKFQYELDGSTEGKIKREIDAVVSKVETEKQEKEKTVEQAKQDIKTVFRIYHHLDSMSDSEIRELRERQNFHTLVIDSLLDQEAPERSVLGKDYVTVDRMVMGVVAGVLGQDSSKCGGQETLNTLVDGVLNNKKVPNDSSLKAALDSGLKEYRDAYKKFNGKNRKDAKEGDIIYDPKPYIKLIANALRNISTHVANEAPLSTRHMMAGRMCSKLIESVKKIPELNDILSQELTINEMTVVKGIVAIGEIMADGMEARYRLIKGYEDKMNIIHTIEDKEKAKEAPKKLWQTVNEDIDKYIALRALEQGVNLHDELSKNAAETYEISPIQMLLGTFGFGKRDLYDYVARCNSTKKFLNIKTDNTDNVMEAIGKAWSKGKEIALNDSKACKLGKAVMRECYQAIEHEFEVRGMSMPYQEYFVPKNERKQQEPVKGGLPEAEHPSADKKQAKQKSRN